MIVATLVNKVDLHRKDGFSVRRPPWEIIEIYECSVCKIGDEVLEYEPNAASELRNRAATSSYLSQIMLSLLVHLFYCLPSFPSIIVFSATFPTSCSSHLPLLSGMFGKKGRW